MICNSLVYRLHRGVTTIPGVSYTDVSYTGVSYTCVSYTGDSQTMHIKSPWYQ